MAQELSLQDASGNFFKTGANENTNVPRAIQGHAFSAIDRRGLMVYVGPRDSKGFVLRVRPVDPSSTFTKYTDEEAIVFDLGDASGAAAEPAATAAPAGTSSPSSGTGQAWASATAPAVPSVQSSSAVPTQSANGPKLVDPSVLPAELKSIAAPPGFGVVDGSARRSASGGVFRSAEASWFGKMDIKAVADLYNKSLAKEWDVNDEDVAQGYLQTDYINKKDSNTILYLDAEQTDDGTTIEVKVEKQ